MQVAYLNNRVFKQPDDITRLLYYLKSDPDFQKCVNRFWSIFPKSAEGQITRQQFIELATLIYTFLVPQFTFAQQRKLAQDTVCKLVLNNKLIYDSFIEFFVQLCFETIENLDLRAACGWLAMLFDRVTDMEVVSCEGGPVVQVPYHTEVHVYTKEEVEKVAVENKNEKMLMLNTMYYEEKVVYEAVVSDERRSILYALKKQEKVIPMGFLCEGLISYLSNDNFQTKDSYPIPAQERLAVKDTKIFAFYQQKAMDLLKDALLGKQKLHILCVIHEYLPESNSKLYGSATPFTRLCQYFCRPMYLQHLKTIKGDEVYFNILSQFYDRNEYGIDEIHNVADKWHRKKKASIMGEEKKKAVKKEEVNLEEQLRMLTMKVTTANMKFINAERLKAQLQFLRDKLRGIIEDDKVINIEKYMSRSKVLPRDTDNPFEDDILEYAKQTPLQLLIIGRPKCGKTTLAKKIAAKYGIVHVSMESSVNKIFERVKFFEENPPEVDDNGIPKDGLTPIEKCIIEDLSLGKTVDPGDLLDILNEEMKNPATASKGFILDLPLDYPSKTNWVDLIINNKQLHTPKINCRYFSHVIELEQTDEEWKYFLKAVMEKGQDLTLSSGYERYLQVKPKPPKAQDEEQQQQNTDEKPPILIQSNLTRFDIKVNHPPNIHSILTHLHPRSHLKLKVAGKNIQELIDLLDLMLEKLPQAKKLEGNQKELLTVGLEEKKLVRKWSPWAVVDPVELSRDRLINGKSEFAAEFAGRVFLFENQKNQADFILEPRKYLARKPELPKTFNIVINGPRKSGKRSIAKLLSQAYGLKIVDIEHIIANKLQFQKNLPQHIPSNPTSRSTSVHLSEPEWKDFVKGNSLSAKDILPVVFYELGIKLQKKPQDWGIQRSEEEKAQLEKEREDKERDQALKKAQAAKKKDKKKEKEVKEDQRPKTPPLEDIPLKDLIPQINHLGKLNETRGYIFIGYPSNEEQLQAFKNFNIPIDKYILLSDNSQQNPNKNLSQRLNDAQIQQVAAFFTAVAPVKDALTEQIVKQVLIGDPIETLVTKVRNIIDPFFPKPDDDALNRVSADVQEQDDPIQYGFCGQYCPVVLNEGWLMKGKDTFECGVQGRRFRCFEEKQLNLFKQNPKQYTKKEKLAVPPRLLFMGIRGVGLKTELMKINHKYKIPILHLKDTMLGHLENEKVKRKTERYYNKGFKIPEFDEQGKQIQDAELNQQAADFDRKAHEIQVLRNIFEGIEQILINGNFFDVEEDKVSTNLIELLGEARRLPEAVIMLKVDEKRWLPRVFNTKEVEKQHEKIVEDLKAQKKKEKEQAKQKALEAGEEYQEPAEEQDLGAPKLQDMITERKDKLVAQRQADIGKLDEYAQAFKAANVDVITIDCERDVQHVFDKIVYAIKPYLDNRMNKWDKVDMLKINPDRVSSFLENYIVKESRFGKLNPLTLFKPIKPVPLIYNQRLYYFADEEERETVMENPSLLTVNRAIPKDVLVTPRIFIIGKPKSGKGSLAKLISKKLGLVTIKIKKIIEQFASEHKDPTIQKILTSVHSGQVLSDQLIVDLIEKRVSMADCVSRGWILDGLPRNKAQAELLIKRGMNPSAVFSIQLSDNEIKKRVFSTKSDKYGYNHTVTNERIHRYTNDLTAMEIYFMNKYNNIRFLDGRISKWGIYEIAKDFILQSVKAKQELVRSLVCKEPIKAVNIGLSFNLLLNNLSDYLNFCLVTYKTQRQYAKVGLFQHKYLCLYNRKIYVFYSQKEYNDFLQNPDLYILNPVQFSPPELTPTHHLLTNYDKAENKGYCVVELTKKSLLKGNPAFSIEYKDKLFGIGKANNIKYFLRNPAAYELSKLQDKLPVEFDRKNELKKIAKRSDCTAFLEHHLGNIMMRVLTQLGYRRLKYPRISSKESALKFLAISLKANNPNKDEQYREKYKQKLEKFIKHCNYPQELRDEFERKQKSKDLWKEWDEQNLLKIAEEYKEFDTEYKSTDKVVYFSKFIN